MQVAESVGVGHPDKISDIIADSILEYVLNLDINAQLAFEVLSSKNLIVIAGELFWSRNNLDVIGVVQDVLKNLGYDPNQFKIVSDIKKQSLDIRSSSITGKDGIVSGDQSIVVGYASNETANYLPLSFVVATDLVRWANERVLNKCLKGIKFDVKSLVVLDGKEIKQLVLSVHHEIGFDVEEQIYEHVIQPILKKHELFIDKKNIFINTSGSFIIGGLDADTGITNRKLMVDSYGSIATHGGGGYSGKDLTKVDRLGAYYARWICKNIVAAKICDFMELKLVFCYGSKEPMQFMIEKINTDFDKHRLINIVKSVFPINFLEIYKLFNIPGIKYSNLACYGHFGRLDLDLPWERLDKVDEIKKYLNGC